MAQLKLPRDLRLTLRAQAHHLDPVVLLGSSGLTDAVRKEVDRELNIHGLIKVKVPSDDREERVAIYEELAETLEAAKIQLIGKLFVLYRPIPEKNDNEKDAKSGLKATAEKKPRKTGAKARNSRKKLTERIRKQKGESKAKNLPWNAKNKKKGKTPKGQVKEVGEKGFPLGKRQLKRS